LLIRRTGGSEIDKSSNISSADLDRTALQSQTYSRQNERSRNMSHASEKEDEQWWVASLGDTLIWARLRVRDSGTAEVLDAAGETLRYDDEDAAHAALLDAEFRAYDGLDDDDAAALGFDLESVAPPEAESDEALLPLMTEKLLRGHA
jgi:hypothetical protein